MSESAILQRVRLHLARLATLFRNNSGRFQDATGRWVQYGVGIGGSDLIGFRSRQISLDDVGKKVAVFVAIETKTEKELAFIRKHEAYLKNYAGHDPKCKRYKDQLNFIARVKEAGGIAGMASDEREAEAIVKGEL